MTSKAATLKMVVAGGAVPPAGNSKEEVMSMEEVMRARHFATALGIDVVVIGTSPATEKAIDRAVEAGAISELKAAEGKELSCHKCAGTLVEDEAIWATESGALTMHGDPYCDACLPEEKQEEESK